MFTGKMIYTTSNLKKSVLQCQNLDGGSRLLVRNYATGRKFINNSFMRYLIDRIAHIPHEWKQESSNLLRVWVRQCECVLAQRVRRSQQMFSLYTRLWEEQALRKFIKDMRQQVSRRGKEFVFSAIGVAGYNWEQQRIPEAEIRSHIGEMEYIKVLKEKTIMCRICKGDPEKIDSKTMTFCECKGRKDTINTYEDWTVFVEETDLIVWRRERKGGTFEWKVYGSYNDVSAEDFLSVQIDTEYRKMWDTSAIALDIIERDLTPNSNSDLIYWETQWPKMFSNRDYVFNRRFLVDAKAKVLLLVSRGTTHPNFPAKSNKFRVQDYWSNMVIKPYSAINKPGLEFSLTYYDNPGANIPQSVTSWVAYRAMPDFLTRLREATRKYKDYCKKQNCNSIYVYKEPEPVGVLQRVDDETDIVPCEPDSETADDKYEENIFDVLSNDINNDEPVLLSVRRRDRTPKPKLRPVVEREREITQDATLTSAEIILSPTPMVQNDQSYWKYLRPTYYIS